MFEQSILNNIKEIHRYSKRDHYLYFIYDITLNTGEELYLRNSKRDKNFVSTTYYNFPSLFWATWELLDRDNNIISNSTSYKFNRIVYNKWLNCGNKDVRYTGNGAESPRWKSKGSSSMTKF